MKGIRLTLLSTSLSLAVAGAIPLAAGQNTKQTSNDRAYPPPPPVRTYVPPPRTQPNSQRVATPPPKNVKPTNTAPIGVVPKGPVHGETTTRDTHNPAPAYGHTPLESGNGNNGVAGEHPSSVTAGIKSPTRPVYTLPGNSALARNPGVPTALDKSGSQSVVQQVNNARRSMRGINSRPLPQGNVLVHPNGALTIEGKAGQQYHVRQDGTLAAFEAHGVKTTFRPDGTIRAVRTANMQINYGAGGARRVETIRPDHSVLVSTGPGQGYLQRTVIINNTTVVQRTYVVNNVTYVRYYTRYTYGGVVLEHYVPVAYYAPAFYGWVYYPWPRPVAYHWEFVQDPWYVYYGGYFTPALVYPTPTLWLTDYALAQALDSAYQDRPATAPKGENLAQTDTAISPETKQLLAAQMQQMVAAGNKAAGDGHPESDLTGELPDVVNHERTVFVVASALDVSSENGECGLTPGDILQMDAPLPQDAVTADVRVISSKRMDCAASSKVTVSVQELQEMNNNLRQRVDEGMQVLRAKQGTDGLPPAPPDAIAPPPRPNYLADTTPVTGEELRSMIVEQQRTADATPQVIQNEFGA